MPTSYTTDSNYAENFSEPVDPVRAEFLASDGNPMGGETSGPGFRITWQNGVVRHPDDINGANVYDLLEAVRQRLEFFNDGKFRCRENSLAITHIEEAMHWCQARITDRKKRGVLSTMEK